MIDFRYHIVSIVSIFLALAVGIVLGAGPLKEDLGNTLSDQVTALREDANKRRAELSAAQKGIVGRDDFITAVNPAITADTLADRTVALVVAPAASADLVSDVRDILTGAGATIGSTVTLSDNWVDPEQAAARAEAVTPLAPLVGVSGATTSASMPATVLARSILTTTTAAEKPTVGATQALQGLADADLVQVSPADVVPATSAVLVSGPVDVTDSTARESVLASYVDLAEAMAAAGSGAVVTAPSDVDDPGQSVGAVTAVRADSDAAKLVSTVDDGNLPMGQSTVALALRDQYAGVVGHYGMADDASAVVPQVTPNTTSR